MRKISYFGDTIIVRTITSASRKCDWNLEPNGRKGQTARKGIVSGRESSLTESVNSFVPWLLSIDNDTQFTREARTGYENQAEKCIFSNAPLEVA
jgi:hypothetical protein